MINIGGIQKTTLIDFPGKIAATIFLIGCNFRCPFCYSSELVLPELSKIHPRISEEELEIFLKERKRLIDGIVICGGEPTINEDLPRFIKKIRKFSYSIKLDTNGSNPEMLKRLIDEGLVDYVAMDIKTSQKFQKYDDLVGMKGSLKKVKKSVDILKEEKVNYEFRVTVVPEVHTKEDVIEIAKWLKGAKKLYLQTFRPEKTIDIKFEEIKPYSREFLEEIKKDIASFFEICEVRG